MTSPVDTSVKFFNSTMPGAPVISGTVGTLITLLDACLKDGFDVKTLTSLVAAGGVMTATFAGTHSALVDSVVLVAGVTGGPTGFAGANGEQKITARLLATTATWATALPDGTYTGTITMKMAPLGWTKPFSGTNVAAYQSGDPASTKMFLRVDDTLTTWARVRGYESMTDVNTGLGLFPTDAQVSGGGYWVKSTGANATANAWSLHGDGRTFFIGIQAAFFNGPSYQNTAVRMFGDVISYKPGGDAYACALNYSTIASPTSMTDGGIGQSNAAQTAMPRDYTGLGSSVVNFPYPFLQASTSHSSGLNALPFGPFPSAVDGGLWLSQKYLGTSSLPPRALIPGVLECMQSGVYAYFKMGDRAPGTGQFAGRTLMAMIHTDSSATFGAATTTSSSGAMFFDITGPWR